MNFFDHKNLGNHLLQLCPKVVKHPVYLQSTESRASLQENRRKDKPETVAPDIMLRLFLLGQIKVIRTA